MNKTPVTETSATDTNWHLSKTVLNAGELTGSLSLLGPGSEAPESVTGVDRVLYVTNGHVIATVGASHYILKPDETLHVLADRPVSLRNNGELPAKVFTLTLPPRKKNESALVYPQ